MVNKEILYRQLKNFSIAQGKPVIVHTSLKAVGEIDGGAQALLSVLKDFFAFGDGLLCVPVHTWKTLVMDLRTNESCIGVFPSVAVADPDAKRSLHPTHSMVVFGKNAEDFIKNEAFVDSPVSPAACYGNIYKMGGFVLLIGVDQRKNTFLHCVEEMLNVPGRLTDNKIEATIIQKDGNEIKRKLHWFDETEIPDVSVNFGKFEKAFRYHNCIVDGMIGNAPAQLCDAVKMKNVIELIYKNAGGAELLADNSPLDEKLYK